MPIILSHPCSQFFDGSPTSSFGVQAPEHSIHSASQSWVSSQTHFQPLSTSFVLLLQWSLSLAPSWSSHRNYFSWHPMEQKNCPAEPSHTRLMKNKALFEATHCRVVCDTAEDKWNDMHLILSSQWVLNTGQDAITILQRKEGRIKGRPLGSKEGWPVRRETKMADLKANF